MSGEPEPTAPAAAPAPAPAILGEAMELINTAPDRAEELLLHCLNAAGDDDLVVEAEASYALGRLAVNSGRTLEALTFIDRARSSWSRAGDDLAALRTDLGRMHVLDDLGRHADSITVGEDLLTSLEELESRDRDATWLRAAAGENLAVAYGYQGHHERALAAHREAYTCYVELDLVEDAARSLANQGVELLDSGRAREALSVFREARATFEEGDDRLLAAQSLTDMARAELALGFYGTARTTLSWVATELDGLASSPQWIRARVENAGLHVDLNLAAEALAEYDRVLDALSETELARDEGLARLGRGTLLVRHRETLGVDPDDDLSAAKRLFAALGDGPMLARTCLVQAELEEPANARALANEALQLLAQADRPVEEAAAWLMLALRPADEEEARLALGRAAELLEPLALPQMSWRLEHARAAVARRSGDSERAIHHLTEAVRALGELRSWLVDERLRLPFLVGRDRVVDDLVTVLLDTGRAEEATRVIKQFRAQTLTDRIQGSLASTNPTTLDSLELQAVHRALLHAEGHRRTELLQRARSLESAPSPRSGSMTDPAGETVDPGGGRDAEGLLSVIHHVLGDEICCVVEQTVEGEGEVEVRRRIGSLERVQVLLGRLERHRTWVSDRDLADRHGDRLLAIEHDLLGELHHELMAPITDLFGATQTSLSPASSLAGVPFAALGPEGHPLIEKTAVVMTPAPGLSNMLDQRRRSLNRSLIVGVADDDAPRIGGEASTIAANHPDSTLLLDGEATISAIATSIDDFDLVHLACHGVHRNDNPWFHSLRLGDRWITAREITRWKLDGQLVILSACDSGRQRGVQTANELFGLPYAFLAAGASAVLVNLWPADDEASEILMVAFHRLLAEGVPGAVALREAQLMVRPQLKFPVHWANAVLIGSPNHRRSQP